MKSGFISGMLIGTAVGLMVMPNLDKNTRNRVKRADRFVMNVAEGMYNGLTRRKHSF